MWLIHGVSGFVWYCNLRIGITTLFSIARIIFFLNLSYCDIPQQFYHTGSDWSMDSVSTKITILFLYFVCHPHVSQNFVGKIENNRVFFLANAWERRPHFMKAGTDDFIVVFTPTRNVLKLVVLPTYRVFSNPCATFVYVRRNHTTSSLCMLSNLGLVNALALLIELSHNEMDRRCVSRTAWIYDRTQHLSPPLPVHNTFIMTSWHGNAFRIL